ncbi:MAG: YraN family protein [Nitrospirae bacterium]|nr:MAG: YraN family protein [Nitrospirota bacterium]
MEPDPRAYGRLAEDAAEQYLRRRGYQILGRNVRFNGGELDLIARQGEIVVFVEVKARRTSAFGETAYAVTDIKARRIAKLASQYLAQRGLTDRWCRFDVILCEGDGSRSFHIQHLEGAFEAHED